MYKKEEFDEALLELRNRKVPGVDKIPAVLIKKYCGENTKKMIYEPIRERYELDEYIQSGCVLLFQYWKKHWPKRVNNIERQA